MMTNVPKPDLERGAYIVYTDEPGEILSPGSAGGGGVAFFDAEYSQELAKHIPSFSFNDLKKAFISGKAVFVRAVYSPDGVYTHYETLEVIDLISNETDSFTAQTIDIAFIATDPDEPMEEDAD